MRAFGAGLAACSAAAVVAQAQAVAVQQAQQQGSGLAAGLAALGYGGSPLGALGSPAQLQSTGTEEIPPSRRPIFRNAGVTPVFQASDVCASLRVLCSVHKPTHVLHASLLRDTFLSLHAEKHVHRLPTKPFFRRVRSGSRGIIFTW